jgi:hypothetical protein
MPASVSGQIEGVGNDFLYGPSFLPLSNGCMGLDVSWTHCLRSPFLVRLDSWHNACSDASRDFFCDAIGGVVCV